MDRTFRPIALALGAVLGVAMVAHEQTPTGPLPFLNPDLPFESRAADVVARMTRDEKIQQLSNAAPAIERLGIPAYNWWNEALHGVARAGGATVFPQAIGMAATFDPSLMHEVATAISDEARAKHHEFVRRGQREIYQGLTFWSPNINIFRDPRWGRGQETYGEDPYLTARMGVEFVKGLQGDDPKYLKLVATAKHFAVHSGPEADRHRFDVKPTERDLFETYLPAFRALVQEARVQSVMGAYNRVNGESASASTRLLDTILRREWGFDGYVVSDCGAIHDIYATHRIVARPEEAAALAVRNGCDLECGTVYQSLAAALDRTLIDERDIDVAVRRLMLARLKLGMFDPPERVRYAQIPYRVNQSPEHDQLARRMAQSSIVLLKNSGLLPLPRTLGSIAVIGPNANEVMALLGNYYGTPAAPVTVLEGIRNAVGPATKVVYAHGADLVEGRTDPRALAAIDSKSLRLPGAKDPFDEALDAARAADVVVFVGGLNGDVEGEEMSVSFPGFSGGDRTSLDLPATQDKLLRALHALGKPIVLVLMTGSAMSVEWAQQNLPAIVVGWYAGQQGGNAIADVLFGSVNPSGRLPVTFYKSVAQLPPFDDYNMKGRTYRYFEGTPLYPFGHGLSYTQFRYAAMKASVATAAASDPVTVSVTVTNTGRVAGAEIVQLYARAVRPMRSMPIRRLSGFQRISLKPGERRDVTFRIAPMDAFSFYDEGAQRFAVDPGEYALEAGASSADIRATAVVRIK